VTVPAGNRWLQIMVELPLLQSTTGAMWVAILRETTVLNYYPVYAPDTPTAANGQGNSGSYVTWDQPFGPNNFAYSVAIAANPAFGGTVSSLGGLNQPQYLTVSEI